MKKVFSLFVLPILLVVSPVWAQSPRPTTDTQIDSPVLTGPNVLVAADEVINRSFVVGAGDVVEVAGTVNGDMYVAGGQVIVSGQINGDLIAAGGTITITGTVTQDVRLIGGTIVLSGEVGQNLTVMAGNLTVTDGATLAGGMILVGGSANVLASVSEDVIVAAGDVSMMNTVGGDVEAWVGSLRLGSDAGIGGNLSYNQDASLTISDTATVSGQQIVRQPIQIDPNLDPDVQVDFEIAESIAMGFAWLSFWLTVANFVSLLIFGWVVIWLVPRFVKAAAAEIDVNPGKALLVGFGVLVLTPIIILVLLMTFLGIPLALMLLAIYMIYTYIGKLVAAYWLGSKLFNRLNQPKRTYLAYFVGLLILYVIFFIPIIGWFVWVLALVIGMGAMTYTQYLSIPRLQKK